MQTRWGIGLMMASLLAVVGGYAWWKQGQPVRPRTTRIVGTRGSMTASFGSSGSSVRGFMGNPVSTESRFYATQAAKVGPATVSYRFIRPDDGSGRPVLPGTPFPTRPGPFFLGIQVVQASSSITEQRATVQAESLRAVDDTGKTIVHTASKGDGDWNIDGGMVFQFRMESPAENALSLRRLVGSLDLEDHGKHRVLPFSLDNIPLPNCVKLVGRMVPRIVSPEFGKTLSPDLSIATGEEMDQAISESLAIPVPQAISTQRIQIGDGIPVNIGVPTPGSATVLSIAATRGKFGVVNLEIGHGIKRARTRIWDGEPILAVLPAGSGPRLALLVRIRNESQSGLNVTPTPLFPAASGRPGGSIQASVKVGDLPFGRGQLTVSLSQMSGAGWSDWHSAITQLNSSGILVLPNISPGKYRLARKVNSLTPNIPAGAPEGTVDEYLKERFGAMGGRWIGEELDSFEVRSGQTTTLPPLQYVQQAGAVAAIKK